MNKMSDDTLEAIGAIVITTAVCVVIIFVIVKVIKYAWLGTW